MARQASRLLLDTLVERYQSLEHQELTELARWNDYANAMREVYTVLGDLDVVTLFAEAMMNRTPWRLWDLESGEPFDHADTLEMMAVLEKVWRKAPIPIRVFCTCTSIRWRCRPCRNAPCEPPISCAVWHRKAGICCICASHIYIQCGHYYDALAVLYNATAADRKYIAYANLGRDDRYLSACCHNFHQLMTAATYLGQYEAALYAANAVQRLLTEGILRTDIPAIG